MRDLEEWDLVVVGAGPAGSAAALAALTQDPAARVLLLDRAEFPRDKACGDGIAPLVLDALAQLGVHDAADGWAPLDRLVLARGDGGDRVARTLRRPVWVIPRQVFDARLADHAVRRGAVRERHRVQQVSVDADGITVDGTVRTRVLVGADGAQSVVRRAVSRPRPRRALAIRGYSPTADDRRSSQVIVYGDRRQPSYAWAFDRGDGLSNVGYGELLGVHDDPPSRSLLVEELDRLLPGAADGATDWRAHHLPLSGARWTQPDGRVLLAGDAADLVNPMTGEGIYYAVATGASAGRAAAAGAQAGAVHRRTVQRLLSRHLRHTWVVSRLSRSPRMVGAGIHAAARHRRAFDDLVELGLGRGTVTAPLLGALGAALVTRRP